MFNYVTLDSVKAHYRLPDTTVDDDKLLDYIDWSSRLIENWKGRRYDPRVQTRVFDCPQANGSGFGVYDFALATAKTNRILRLDDDLLEVVKLLNGDSVEITDYVTEPANEYPKNRIALRSSEVFVPSDDGPEQAISLSGIWGYHDRWAEAWSVLGALTGSLSASADEITVSGVEIGQLLRLDTEYVLVLDISSTTATVERGYNGTTAAVHASGTDIELFHPMSTIVQCCMRLVKWRYTQKDSDNFDRTFVMGAGAITTPTSLPADVVRILGPRKARL